MLSIPPPAAETASVNGEKALKVKPICSGAQEPLAVRLSDGTDFYNATGGQGGGGGLTDAELRAAAVPVSLAVAPTTPVTGTFWQATQPVSLASAPVTPVTDNNGSLTVDGTVSVSGSVAVTGTFWQATQPVSGTVTATGPLTDVQLRATAVPVSGPLTDAQLRATAVPTADTHTAAAAPLSVRLSDGSAFYNASGGGGGGGSNFNAAFPSSGTAMGASDGTNMKPLKVDVATGALVVRSTAPATYYVLADAVAFTQNKHHISVFNGAGSGKLLRVSKLFAINNQLAAATGVAVRFDVKRTTAQSAGTAITPQLTDTADGALPAQVLLATGATITEGGLLYPFVTTNDEAGATNAFPSGLLQQFGNLMPEGNEIRELRLREGQGITVKQITNSTVGSFAWLMVITAE